MLNLFLVDFSVLKPDPGLLFWTTVIFVLVWGLLGKAAFGPIQKALKKRDDDIQNSIDEAKRVREEMTALKADNERLLAEAREERTKMLRDAEGQASQIIAAAKDEAKQAAQKVATDAKRDIENMRQAAIVDLKQQVGTMAVDIAEKILHRELDSNNDHQAFIKDMVSKLN
ncbi:MAG: F0F1 ATP synthase subunit B [Bacteroidota bacterium]